MSMSVDSIKSAGTIVVTILIFVFVAMWSVAVWQNLGSPPKYLPDGKTVKIDEFARAKDIFVLVLPLLTTAVGYWLGSQGTVKAQQRADDAEAAKTSALQAASAAKSEAAATQAVLDHVKGTHPQAFAAQQ